MDYAHSKLWELINAPEHEWSIIDATNVIAHLMPFDKALVPSHILDQAQLAVTSLKLPIKIEAREVQKDKDSFWVTIEERLQELEKNCTFGPKLSKDEFTSLLLYLVALLFTDLPPRRNKDWQTMRLIERDNNIGNKFDGEYIYFRAFKSRLRDGPLAIPCLFTPRLKRILKLYCKHHPNIDQIDEGTRLLVDANGKSFTKINSITRLLQKALGTSAQELRKHWFSRFT